MGRVIGRPSEFTREWAYTALSRARTHTTIHLIAEPHERDREREQYAPPEPQRDLAQIPGDLRLAMRHSETEALAVAHIPRASTEPPLARPHDSVRLLSAAEADATVPPEPAGNAAGPAAVPHQSTPVPNLSTRVGVGGTAVVEPVAPPAPPKVSPLKHLSSLRRLRSQPLGPSVRR